MKLETIQRSIEGVPFIQPELAEDICAFIRERQPRQCLELGFGHGASSSFIAAALEEVGRGHLTAVDLKPAREWQPPAIEDLLERSSILPTPTSASRTTGGPKPRKPSTVPMSPSSK